MKNWIVEFKTHGSGNDRVQHRPILLTEPAAMEMIRQRKTERLIDFHDEKGALIESLESAEIKGIRRLEEAEWQKDLVWICDHQRPQKMSQGIYVNEFGKKEWSGKFCACV